MGLDPIRSEAESDQLRGSPMTISFDKVDLNLLRVFDAVVEERSVLRAGQRICLSQSAVSHALARLREMLDDDLFIRTAAGIQPTASALTMAPLIREGWKSLEAAIGMPKFEPGNSARRFTIAVSDFVTMVMVPHLLGLLRREAPIVDLVIRPDSRIDLTEQIDLGQIDAAIGTFSDVPARFRLNSLFAYDDVLIANSSRELGKPSLETLSGLSIAVVSLHGEQEGIVDGFVSERGLARRSEIYDRTAFERAFSGLERNPRMCFLLAGQNRVELGSRAFDMLVRRGGEVVSRRQILDEVWPDFPVDESNLRVQISDLRRALSSGNEGSTHIMAVQGRGYVFVAPVQSICPFRSFRLSQRS
jgi:DNA-binding transcriptional LysR family regulator